MGLTQIFSGYIPRLSFISGGIANDAPLNHLSIKLAATGHPSLERITLGMSRS